MPNLFLDRLLADLTDTEARVLLVLLRRTAGWGRPNDEVTISYRDLKRLTGRQSEAISRALKSLQARGLIHSPISRLIVTPEIRTNPASKTEDQHKYRKR